LISKFVFEYGYFFTPNCGNTQDCYRLKLNRIQKFGQNGESLPPYIFTYDNQTLPKRTSQQVDWWGYFNGKQPPSENAFPKLYFYPDFGDEAYNVFNLTSYSGTKYTLPGFDKSPHATKAKAGILKKIEYPTGGFTSYEYEINEFNYRNEVFKGGGLRIKKIISDDGNGETIESTYEYNTPNSSGTSGQIVNIPRLATMCECTTINNSTTASQIQNNTLYFRGNVNPEINISGTLVHYPDVTIHKGEGYIHNTYKSVNWPTNQSNYENGNIGSLPCYYDYYNPLFDSQNGLSPKFGQLISQKFYHEQGGLVSKSTFQYNDLNDGIKTFTHSANVYGGASTTNYTHFHYRNIQPTETTQHIYDTNQGTFKTSSLSQNNYTAKGFLESEETDGSDSSNKQYYTVVGDFDTITSTNDNPTLAVKQLFQQNSLTQPVESYSTIVNSGSEHVIKGLYFEYEHSALLRLKRVYALNEIKPISNFNPASYSGSTLNKDSDYELLYEITEIDGDGNPLESTDRFNNHTTYLWGYNNSRLIAVIKLESKSSVDSFLSSNGYNNLNTLNNTQVESLIGLLQSHFENNYITGYVYDENTLQLKTSIDENEIKTHYEYDNLHRLGLIRDDDSFIINKYLYHYRNN